MNFLKNICFIRNPQHLGQKTLGVNYAPYILTGKFPNIDAYNTYNNHDKTYDTLKRTKRLVLNHARKTYEVNNALQQEYRLPINLGGDHSISIGSVTSSIKNYGDDLRVVWVDAHADLNTINASESKNFHGMSANFILNIEKKIPRWLREHHLHPEQLLYIGLRDLDSYEVEKIRELNIEYYDMKMIRKYGLHNLLDYNDDFSAIHLSLDVDSIDPTLMPSTGTPVPNGLNLEEIFQIIDLYRDRMINMDLVELNPLIGTMEDSERSVRICKNILDYIIQDV